MLFKLQTAMTFQGFSGFQAIEANPIYKTTRRPGMKFYLFYLFILGMVDNLWELSPLYCSNATQGSDTKSDQLSFFFGISEPSQSNPENGTPEPITRDTGHRRPRDYGRLRDTGAYYSTDRNLRVRQRSWRVRLGGCPLFRGVRWENEVRQLESIRAEPPENIWGRIIPLAENVCVRLCVTPIHHNPRVRQTGAGGTQIWTVVFRWWWITSHGTPVSHGESFAVFKTGGKYNLMKLGLHLEIMELRKILGSDRSKKFDSTFPTPNFYTGVGGTRPSGERRSAATAPRCAPGPPGEPYKIFLSKNILGNPSTGLLAICNFETTYFSNHPACPPLHEIVHNIILYDICWWTHVPGITDDRIHTSWTLHALPHPLSIHTLCHDVSCHGMARRDRRDHINIFLRIFMIENPSRKYSRVPHVPHPCVSDHRFATIPNATPLHEIIHTPTHLHTPIKRKYHRELGTTKQTTSRNTTLHKHHQR